MSGHFIKKCSGCERVLTQCRCPVDLSQKTVQWGWCEDCRPADAAPERPNLEAGAHPESEIPTVIKPEVLPSVMKLAALALESRGLPNHANAIRQGAEYLEAAQTDVIIALEKLVLYEAELVQCKEIRADMEHTLVAAAKILGVPQEPHQNWEERFIEAARDAPRPVRSWLKSLKRKK